MSSHVCHKLFSCWYIVVRHARDLQARGHTISQILAAGEWRSAAFMSYLDDKELAAEAVVEAHLDESTDDECG